MRTADFDFTLPPELVAQEPTLERDQSRLLTLTRKDSSVSHGHFADLTGLLRPTDLLVLNDSRVLPARMQAVKAIGGGAIEVLLLEENSLNDWWGLVRPAKRVRPGARLCFRDRLGRESVVQAWVLEKNAEGHCRMAFFGVANIEKELKDLGEIPLPPYITRQAQTGGINDFERYQTVFANEPGSVAAPTAGLHFTDGLLSAVRSMGVGVQFVTLHVGLGTFAPVKTETVQSHVMHEERFHVSDETVRAINRTKQAGGRVVAVGTTTVRVLETIAAQNSGQLQASAGRTQIFIHPPCQFRVVDALVTNFHLPRSTLLMLVSAFAAPNAMHGREMILSAYAEAIREGYRFFSYGDAMFIL